jgi:hypothetical protein
MATSIEGCLSNFTNLGFSGNEHLFENNQPLRLPHLRSLVIRDSATVVSHPLGLDRH